MLIGYYFRVISFVVTRGFWVFLSVIIVGGLVGLGWCLWRCLWSGFAEFVGLYCLLDLLICGVIVFIVFLHLSRFTLLL